MSISRRNLLKYSALIGAGIVTGSAFGGLSPLSNGTGEYWAFGRSATDAMNEFAGANFSPDGSTMYVNIQNPSMTFAIAGPWDGAPDPEIPEVPLNVLLPLTAAAVGAGAVALNSRRNDDVAEAPAGA